MGLTLLAIPHIRPFKIHFTVVGNAILTCIIKMCSLTSRVPNTCYFVCKTRL